MSRIGEIAGAFVVLGILASGSLAEALETDQYYGIERPLRDSADIVNAKVNLEIDRALAEVNSGRRWETCACEDVVHRIVSRFRFPLVKTVETWAVNSSLVDRIPANADEERRYRREFLYGSARAYDRIRWVPPSPTIDVDGIRFGTDKLSHFFSEGLFYHRLHRLARRLGDTEGGADRRAAEWGTLTERTVLGLSSAGVLSPGDLEANYQGMLFYEGLCREDGPAIVRTESGWRLEKRFDIREYVSPVWDESWGTPVYTRGRWKKVRPALERRCPLLDDPAFRARREAYAKRDRDSVGRQVVQELVDEGKIPDPSGFSLETVCGKRSSGPPPLDRDSPGARIPGIP